MPFAKCQSRAKYNMMIITIADALEYRCTISISLTNISRRRSSSGNCRFHLRLLIDDAAIQRALLVVFRM